MHNTSDSESDSDDSSSVSSSDTASEGEDSVLIVTTTGPSSRPTSRASTRRVSDADTLLLSSPPPSTPLAGDTPVRLRLTPSSTPRFATPNPTPAADGDPDGAVSTGEDGGILLNQQHLLGPRSRSNSYQDLMNRPRSNPRTRTPMRNPSAVGGLAGVNRSTIVHHEEGEHEEQQQRGTTTSTGGRGVALTAGLSVGTVLRESDVAAMHRERMQRDIHTNGHDQYKQKSNKQGPSHRKVRRWNNDKLVGVATEISRANPTIKGLRVAQIYGEAELHKNKHIMPHKPMEYNSSFTTLLKGGSNTHKKGDDDGSGVVAPVGRMHRQSYDREHVASVKERFLNGEMPGGRSNTSNNDMHNTHRALKRQEEIFSNGENMIKLQVQERLLNVVRRACRSSDATKEVLCAFERTLVRHLSYEEEFDFVNYDEETTQRHDEVIMEQVLVQKPMVTRKKSSIVLEEDDGSENTKEVTRVTLRFLFDNEKANSGSGGGGTFHRLLLHGACQFHGLDTAWSTTSKGRLLTVTGSCKGCQFQMLDFLDLEEQNMLGYNAANSPKSGEKVSESAVTSSSTSVLKAISTLKVS